MPDLRVPRAYGLLVYWVKRNGVCVITHQGKAVNVLLNPAAYPRLMPASYGPTAVAVCRRRNPGNAFSLADDVFKAAARADQWMAQENQSLDGIRPVDLLGTVAGIEEVRGLLFRIAFGEFS